MGQQSGNHSQIQQRKFSEIENERAAKRRADLKIGETKVLGKSFFGLTLSGGGIRSATFSLGVLQALAKSSAPPSGNESNGQSSPDTSLLKIFDYLSTVSGGGYIGSFFTSLFIPGRMTGTEITDANRQQQSIAAADLAYDLLKDDPPGRMRSSEHFDPAKPSAQALAWLRENGRYLTPTGAGDFLYAIALQIRNWCAVHYVLGTLFLAIFGAVSVLKIAIALKFPQFIQAAAWQMPSDRTSWEIWWSPFWTFPAAIAFFWLLPCGVGYWLNYARAGLDEVSSKLGRAFSLAMWFNFAIGIAFLVVGQRVDPIGFAGLSRSLFALGAISLLAVVFHAAGAFVSSAIEQQRVYLTRWLSNAFELTIVLSIVALLDTASQTTYFWLMGPDSPVSNVLTPAAIVGALIWAVRKSTGLFSEQAKPGWVSRLPISLITGIFAGALFIIIALGWSLLVQWVIWQGSAPSGFTDGELELQLQWSIALALGTFALAAISGQFAGFINLSTLQSFYSARLTRAYLGASNGKRFLDSDTAKWRSVAEPHPDDGVLRTGLYAESVASPLHIINVTMNQTTDPAEQLVQRDRKGKSLAVGPAGYLVDGKHYDFDQAKDDLSIGEWIGTSGAAFTTGLGRATSLGTSLLLGIANIRMGTWWRSRLGENRAPWWVKFFLTILKTQTYLLYELTSKFHGNHRNWQYLSDGGHFENTGAYELLRPERDVRVIVVSDNGCDPDYQFNDVANLIRLARIDFKAHFEVDCAICENAALKDIFGTDEDFRPAKSGASTKCALLLKVTYPQIAGSKPRFVIVLKPRLIKGASLDIDEYQLRHNDFPQQSTLNQFFDEAQWESYRKLGLEIGTLVFGEQHGKSLWEYLEKKMQS
ncbi:MAG: hypothetical protein JWN94_1515 [Betaproteobacteria bacterium]|nr:hypothetical protein [Betaproteobacteria bacterium]